MPLHLEAFFNFQIMKWLAIDFGERRLGLAIGSEETSMAFPRPWIDTREQPDVIQALRVMIQDERPQSILLGLPLRTDGKPSEKATKVLEFAQELQQHFKLPIVYRDEAFTSVEAKQRTSHLSTKRKQKDKGLIDSAAACLLLQEHLDCLRNSLIG
jgi:putative Holliday junction resolvase